MTAREHQPEPVISWRPSRYLLILLAVVPGHLTEHILR
jgi:hypothetical protein